MPVWMMWLIFAMMPIMFVAMWCAITILSAHLGGWARLAREFGTLQPTPARDRFGPARVWFGMARYRGGVTLYPEPDGVYVRMTPLLRLAHPPLLIPYSALAPFEEHRGLFNLVFYKGRVLAASGTVQITIFDEYAAKAIIKAQTHTQTA